MILAVTGASRTKCRGKIRLELFRERKVIIPAVVDTTESNLDEAAMDLRITDYRVKGDIEMRVLDLKTPLLRAYEIKLG